MRRRAARGAACLAALATASAPACGTGSTREPDAAPVAAHLEATSGPFAVYGLPGPWSREGASREEFDRDMRACRLRSTAARRAPRVEDRSDAAYRAFLECMGENEWIRGALPGRPRQVSRAGSRGEEAALP